MGKAPMSYTYLYTTCTIVPLIIHYTSQHLYFPLRNIIWAKDRNIASCVLIVAHRERSVLTIYPQWTSRSLNSLIQQWENIILYLRNWVVTMKWVNQNRMDEEAGALAPEPYQIRLSVRSEAGVGIYGRVPGPRGRQTRWYSSTCLRAMA